MSAKTWLCASSVLALCVATPALAQVPAQAAAPAANSEAVAVEEVVVTGSRIQRRDFTSPSPITTASAESIKATGAVNLESALNQLPQFSPGQGATNGTVVGGGGRATLNLRGLGEQRNLVLLDGRRLPTSNALGVVDLNILPTSIVQGVEVISGGASAVYGSDAISGVANFRSLSKFEGLSLDVQYGDSFKSDARSSSVAITGGKTFADDRGHALVALSTSERQELTGAQRSFFKQAITGSSSTGMGVISYLPGNLPTQAAINSVFSQYGVAAGTVSTSSGIGFNNDGTLFAATGGANLKAVSDSYRITNGVFTQVVATDNTVIIPQQRYNLFGKVDYALTPDVTVYAQGLYSHVSQKMAQGYPLTVPARPYVSASNPFIPADLKAILNSRPDPNAPFQLNRRFVEVGKRYYEEPFDVFQLLVGAKGSLPWRDLTYDVYASHDETKNKETLTEGVSASRLATLLMASDGGASICAGGYNPFGLANALKTSQACLDYLSSEATNTTKVSQDIVEGTLQGRLFTLPAGEARGALTLSHRENSYSYTPDPGYVATATAPYGDIYGITATAKSQGSTRVTELAGEALLPLLRDLPLAEALNLSLGYRYSDYNISGGVSTYKSEADWRLNKVVLLRGGYERAVRAPNIAELFTAPTGAIATIGQPASAGDPCDYAFSARSGANGINIRNLCLAQGVPGAIIDTFNYRNGQVISTVSGNKDLQPEVADTYTAGVVLTSPFEQPLIAHATLSVDYYSIKIDKAISTMSGTDVLNKCFNLDGSNPTYSNTNVYCATIKRDATTGAISAIATPYQNLGGYKTKGVDIQFDWRVDLDELGLGRGRLSASAVVNYLDTFQIQTLTGGSFVEYAGTIGTSVLPKWKSLVTVGYQLGDVGLGVRWRRTGEMDDVTAVTRPASPSPGVAGYNIYDLTANWAVNSRLELRGGITNLADKQPLVVAGVLGTTNGGVYDVVGRSYYLAAKMRF